MTAEARALVVRKLRDDGSEAFRWPARLLERTEQGVVLAARFNATRSFSVGEVTLVPGDVFVEFYYFDRCFNVYQVYSPQGAFKAWYCNVGTPAWLDGSTLVYTDLVLDLLVKPNGEYQVLDQDEFEQRRAGYSPELLRAASDGLQALRQLAERRALPGRPFEEAIRVLNEVDS